MKNFKTVDSRSHKLYIWFVTAEGNARSSHKPFVNSAAGQSSTLFFSIGSYSVRRGRMG